MTSGVDGPEGGWQPSGELVNVSDLIGKLGGSNSMLDPPPWPDTPVWRRTLREAAAAAPTLLVPQRFLTTPPTAPSPTGSPITPPLAPHTTGGLAPMHLTPLGGTRLEPPPNMTQTALFAPKRALYTRERLPQYAMSVTGAPIPAQWLAYLTPSNGHMVFAQAVLDALSGPVPEMERRRMLLIPSAHAPTYWEQFIEPYPLTRFLLALAFVRYHHLDDLAGAALCLSANDVYNHRDPRLQEQMWTQLAPVGCGFTRRPRFEKYHARYYTQVWSHLASLLVRQSLLSRQTATYLGTPTVPHLGQPLRAAIAAHGRRNGWNERESWDTYVATLARHNRVPEVLIRSQLDGGWDIRDARAYQWLTNELLRDATMHPLAAARAQLAERLRCDPASLTLMLCEPLTAISL